MASLTYFTVVGTYLAATADSYDVDTDPDLIPMSGPVTFTPLVDTGDTIQGVTLSPAANVLLPPIKASIRSGQVWLTGNVGVSLVANTAALGLVGDLYYRVDFYEGLSAGGVTYQVESFPFRAPTSATTIDLVEVTPTTGQPATGPVPSSAVLSVAGRTGNIVIVANDINGATTVGKSLLTAANLAAIWTTLGTVPDANLPQLSIVDFLGTVANQSAMLALTGQKGDWCLRSDTGAAWIITGTNPTQLSSWTSWPYPTAPVTSVAGRTGAIALTQDDVPDGTTNKAYTAADKTRLAGTSGTNTGDQTSVTGNAGTATKLTTARNINGVAFDGTADITVADSTKATTAALAATNTNVTTNTTNIAANTTAILARLGLVQAAKNPDLLVTGAITLDSSDLVTSAVVAWPDGSPGTLTITSRDSTNAVLAYNITYGSPVTKTYTQPTITRNANGAATNVPAIVVT